MSSSIGGLGSSSSNPYASWITQLDTNNDGNISKSEFVAGAPQGVSSDVAGSLFDTMDTQHSGSLSDSDLATAFQQMSSGLQSMIIQLQSAATGGAQQQDGPGGPDGPGGGFDPSKLFAKLDTNGDGVVSKDEFVAGRPKNMSADQAGDFYDKIAAAANGTTGTDGTTAADSTTTNGLTEDQFAAGLKGVHPHGGHHHHGGGGSAASSTSSDGLFSTTDAAGVDPNDPDADPLLSGSSTTASNDPGQLLDQLLSSLQSNESSNGTTSTSSTPGQSLDQFLQAINAYSSSATAGNAASITA